MASLPLALINIHRGWSPDFDFSRFADVFAAVALAERA